MKPRRAFNRLTKNSSIRWSVLGLFLLIDGCAIVQSGGEVQSGRADLFAGRPEDALVHFRRAAELNPDYVTGFTVFKEGVWTYVGRASYETQNLPEARRALENASSRHSDDYLAKLYLGLTLARDGDRQRGLSEIENGMKGLHDWLEDVSQTHRYSYGEFWDPQREIRSQIRTDLALLSNRELDWPKLIADGEGIGKRMEEEIDRADREERFFRGRPGDNEGGSHR
jgi:tetratricopeptide (TPR) repeat protein